MDHHSSEDRRARTYLKTYLVIIALIGMFALGVFAGRHDYVEPKNSKAQVTIPNPQINNDGSTTTSGGKIDFQQYWQVWDILKQDAYKNNLKDSDLFYGSMEGLVNSLNDPYSLYFRPSAAEEFAKDLSGQLDGIGAEVGIKDNQLVIIAPLPDSPAQRAGLHPGDKILAINKESTTGLDTVTAVQKIRGPAGTSVTLTILNDTSKSSRDITIARARIVVPSLTYSLKEGNIAYIKLNQFNVDTPDLLDKAIAKMPDNLKGVVLDLRGNPGGLLDVAVEVASKWIDTGKVVVEERGRLPEFQKTFTARGGQPFKKVKTIILVNKGSASASEIVAGALQDDKLATLLGEQTFGKGSVQNLYDLPDGSELKLTIAEWFTPLGRNINKEGVKPDIEFKEDWAKEKVGEDAMLNKALGMFK
jgi:carboxyl-terminal processing protease